MGSWSTESFGNDSACDWAYKLENSEDLSFIEATLQTVLDAGSDYLDSRDGEQAVAAAEMVAWLRGFPGKVDSYTETVSNWVKAHPLAPSDELVRKALNVVERVQQDPSELVDMWEGNTKWNEAMANLSERLSK